MPPIVACPPHAPQGAAMRDPIQGGNNFGRGNFGGKFSSLRKVAKSGDFGSAVCA